MTHPFPTSAQHHINRAPLGLQFLPWEKENPEWTSSLPSTAGPFLGDPLKYYITRITKESEKLKREAKLKISSTQIFSSVQSFSHVRLFVTPWTVACQASLSITNSRSLLKLMSMDSVMPPNHLIMVFLMTGKVNTLQIPGSTMSRRCSESQGYERATL